MSKLQIPELNMESFLYVRSSREESTHTPDSVGSRFNAGLINDFITVEALNRLQGKARIPDEECEDS